MSEAISLPRRSSSDTRLGIFISTARQCMFTCMRGDPAEVQTAQGKLHLYVAIDRTSKFAFVQLVERANRRTATAFLEALIAAVPYKIHIILTDNGV
jgi:hypothetical protein